MVYMEGFRNHLLNLYEKEQVEVSTYDAIHGLYKVKLNSARLRDDRLRSFLLFLNLSNLEPDPNSVPDNYIEEVYAVEDYTSTDEGGLSFSRGDRVYVLLRNRFGYCTGWLLFVADSLYSHHKTLITNQ